MPQYHAGRLRSMRPYACHRPPMPRLLLPLARVPAPTSLSRPFVLTPTWVGSDLRGFHVHFCDVARSGIRIGRSKGREWVFRVGVGRWWLMDVSGTTQSTSSMRTMLWLAHRRSRTKISLRTVQRAPFSHRLGPTPVSASKNTSMYVRTRRIWWWMC